MSLFFHVENALKRHSELAVVVVVVYPFFFHQKS